MKVEKQEQDVFIEPTHYVRFTQMGNISEIMASEHKALGGVITTLDRDHFVDNRTGEVREFKHTENRSQSLSSVAQSLKKLRDYLNTNITDVSYCRWLTLTYAENMTDPKRLYRDFQVFVRAARRKYGHFEYIIAAEPQARGAWHLHCVFIFDHKAPFMVNADVAALWKQGFVTIKRLDNVDNVGAYLTAYLGDMELSEAQEEGIRIAKTSQIKEVDVEDENGVKMKKKYVKGARLYMYPTNFNLYRISRGIKKPTVSFIPYREAKRIVGELIPTYSKVVLLSDDETNFSNVLQYEYFNRLRLPLVEGQATGLYAGDLSGIRGSEATVQVLDRENSFTG